jgi:protein-S-isoprenylcysteine O-methyltransferase Ste14
MAPASGSSATRIPSLGPRGEGWVALQVLFMGLTLAGAWVGPRWPESVRTPLGVVGVAMFVVGVLPTLTALRSLGPSLTAMPKPREYGVLKEDGLFGVVRHPIYGGLLAMAAGWALAFTPLAMMPAALLAVVLDLKARREEAWLVDQFPSYPAYRERVRHRFIPGVW